MEICSLAPGIALWVSEDVLVRGGSLCCHCMRTHHLGLSLGSGGSLSAQRPLVLQVLFETQWLFGKPLHTHSLQNPICILAQKNWATPVILCAADPFLGGLFGTFEWEEWWPRHYTRHGQPASATDNWCWTWVDPMGFFMFGFGDHGFTSCVRAGTDYHYGNAQHKLTPTITMNKR